MPDKPKNYKIYREEAKHRLTSHWDLDYMSGDEIEAAFKPDSKPAAQRKSQQKINPMPTVAVVGAGMSGLMCARTIFDHGYSVTVFEKSRGVGGRMSTRRTEDGLRFDHGAQYFTARDKRFQRYLQSWMDDGLVAPWEGRVVVLENGEVKQSKSETERYVATPGMNAICQHLAPGLDIRLQTQVASLSLNSDVWQVVSAEGADLGSFDAVIVSAPAPQTAALLQAAPDLARRARDTEMHGCWALMLALPEPSKLDFDAAFVHNSPISWIAKNSSKPNRESGRETWVIHASAEWSQAHIEDTPAAVENLLLDEFWRAAGITPQHPSHIASHRWRFSIPPTPLADDCLFDAQLRIGACGDWCAGPRVEGAFLSGMAAAERVTRLWKLPRAGTVATN